jgi:ABC-type phosphate/phosphonate transport system substrate-binding protein
VSAPEAAPLRLGACRTQPRVSYALPRLASALCKLLGVQVTAVQRDGYQDLLDGFLSGELDVAWLPPLLHAQASARGAQALAVPVRAGSLTYRSALLVAPGAAVHDVHDLRGVRAAWVDRFSASGYHFPRLELERCGVSLAQALRTEMFHGSTVRAAAAVAAGEADLCACFVTEAGRDLFHAQADLGRALGPLAERLRILHVTGPIPPDGLLAGAAVPPALAQRVADALLHLHETAEGAEVLRGLIQADKLVAPTEAVMRSLEVWSTGQAAD